MTDTTASAQDGIEIEYAESMAWELIMSVPNTNQSVTISEITAALYELLTREILVNPTNITTQRLIAAITARAAEIIPLEPAIELPCFREVA